MALYRRGSVWWVRFTAPGGKRIRKSAGTENKVEAQEFHDRLKAEYWRLGKLGDQPKKSWDDAAEMWLKETAHKADSRGDAAKLKWLEKYLGKKPLTAIDRELLSRIAEIKAREASIATANRYLALIRAVLRKAAFEWGWLESVPKVRMFKESKRRIRWITREQAERLLAELPPHQSDIARFALATGLRQANVLGLEWSQVDLVRRVAWVHPDQAKARKAIAVPLNSEAVSVVRRQLGKHQRFVFSYMGKPIRDVNTKAWQKALKRAGIEDFRWHDLRHTWASWHAQAGTPLHALQELGGWESVEMVRRYAHLAPQHLAEHAARIAPGHKIDTARDEALAETG